VACFSVDEFVDCAFEAGIGPAVRVHGRELVPETGFDLRRAAFDESLHRFVDQPVQRLLREAAQQSEAAHQARLEPHGCRLRGHFASFGHGPDHTHFGE
jgi:hypothetical protein